MKRKKQDLFVPHTCSCCGQTTNYAMSVDRGTAHLVLAVYNAVRRLGRNRVHIDKEMVADKDSFPSYREMIEAGYLTTAMQHNVPRPRYHGLIAFVDRGSGEYLLTPKGAAFLRGEPIERTVIIDKAGHRNDGYHLPDGMVRMIDLLDKEPYWAKAYEI